MRFSSWIVWLATALTLALAGCGGGGGSGDPVLGGGSGATSPTVATLQIKFSASTVINDGSENVTATVTAIDKNGQGVKGVAVTLAVDKNATYTVLGDAGSVTGADGTLKADITIGNDYSLRTITMTATGGGVTATPATFDVVGSRVAASGLTITAPNFIVNSVNNSITVTVTAVDANRNALPNIPVTLRVDKGATIVPSGTATDSNGQMSGVLRIGQDQTNRVLTVQAISGTLTATREVRVTGAQLKAATFVTDVATGSTGNKVTYLLVDAAGAKMVDYPIEVSISGSTPVANQKTDSNGEYQFVYDAPAQAQSIVLTAKAGSVYTNTVAEDRMSSTETVRVVGAVVIPDAVAGSVTSPSISASPNVVSVNPIGATTLNKTEVRALFLAANNAPVKNVRVRFDLDGDTQSIGGTFDSGTSLLYSDANGVARTSYAPGARFSPKEGVTVRACWDYRDFAAGACPNSVRATLTVVSESLSVSIGTNGTIAIGASGLTYVKRYAVQVVDSAGIAKSGVQISPSVDLIEYYKGQWEKGSDFWIQYGRGNRYPAAYPSGAAVPYTRLSDTIAVDVNGNPTSALISTLTACGNEDLNRNGVVESFPDFYEGVQISEDQNGSAQQIPQRPALDPRKADVTIAIEGSNVTNTDGIVVLKIEYPQNLASWVRFNILVAASGVAGTEGRANFDGILPVLASAVTNLSADPPFRFSPYGVGWSDTYLRRNAEGQSAWLCTNPN